MDQIGSLLVHYQCIMITNGASQQDKSVKLKRAVTNDSDLSLTPFIFYSDSLERTKP